MHYKALSNKVSLSSKPFPDSIAGREIRIRPFPDQPPVHDNPLLNRLYAARGVSDKDQLSYQLERLTPGDALLGMNRMLALLNQARLERQLVLIVGDYDADGATATALATLGLQAMGIRTEFLIPNRFDYGYGLSPALVDAALPRSPDIILTVDNGIASIEGVALAKEHGIKVLITDHHLPGDLLPQADAILNPNQPGCPFPEKSVCGCAVVFYLLIALRTYLRDNEVDELPNLAQWLDLVALATVADVVPLHTNNRLLVNQGLKRIRAGYCRPGIRALFEVSGRDWREANSSDFGFVLGPRLNAAGRLDDMTVGVRLLLTESDVEAHQLASELQALNMERRQIETSMLAEVDPRIEQIQAEDRNGYAFFGDDWHEGVIGIVASRIKERLHKPVIVFAPSDDGFIKGSGRSVAGVHIRDCLDWVSKQQPDLITKFGGHAMAAGLTIRAQGFKQFQQLFDDAVALMAEPEALVPSICCDGELANHELTLTNALALEYAGPWGQGFPEPLFCGGFVVQEARVLKGKHVKFKLIAGSQLMEAIAFNVSEPVLKSIATQMPGHVLGTYQLSCNRFRGNVMPQLIFSQLELS